ncbi:Lrp/AsnC family transcriptional regulator [Siccirubricoccus sp. G192]|uniref:siroheme decarboxylase subunit beta n=1 Tax=Siccirubricoccus sp. G192 TaxID=2849651 RepID=UPI001C2C243B|nr:Lrp/AsnC family transcriptional regulator [Siccirubricoccus sp. G192]MBV1797957.1 AsnC family protein [Siccirubricoccus sp. G192]
MDVMAQERALLAALADGLPLEPRPFAALGERLGMTEAEVLEALRTLGERGVVRRFGVVVRHHELGYRANAMVVWDVPDDRVDATGRTLATAPGVTLCYRRPRRPPDWPYNLFCMIHGRDREAVLCAVERAAELAGLEDMPRAVLFSGRRFKQRGAVFGPTPSGEAAWTISTAAS